VWRCVETLTGFKYFGAKLEKYERALPDEIRKKYRQMSEKGNTRRAVEGIRHSTFSGAKRVMVTAAPDFVAGQGRQCGRDYVFCEMAAYASRAAGWWTNCSMKRSPVSVISKRRTLRFISKARKERTRSRGCLSRTRTTRRGDCQLESDAALPISKRKPSRDVEGDVIPKQKMSIFELEDKTRIAVRGSGTEPKIKYYIFAQRRPNSRKFGDEQLARIKREVADRLDAVWAFIERMRTHA